MLTHFSSVEILCQSPPSFGLSNLWCRQLYKRTSVKTNKAFIGWNSRQAVVLSLLLGVCKAKLISPNIQFWHYHICVFVVSELERQSAFGVVITAKRGTRKGQTKAKIPAYMYTHSIIYSGSNSVNKDTNYVQKYTVYSGVTGLIYRWGIQVNEELVVEEMLQLGHTEKNPYFPSPVLATLQEGARPLQFSATLCAGSVWVLMG